MIRPYQKVRKLLVHWWSGMSPLWVYFQCVSRTINIIIYCYIYMYTHCFFPLPVWGANVPRDRQWRRLPYHWWAPRVGWHNLFFSSFSRVRIVPTFNLLRPRTFRDQFAGLPAAPKLDGSCKLSTGIHEFCWFKSQLLRTVLTLEEGEIPHHPSLFWVRFLKWGNLKSSQTGHFASGKTMENGSCTTTLNGLKTTE